MQSWAPTLLPQVQTHASILSASKWLKYIGKHCNATEVQKNAFFWPSMLISYKYKTNKFNGMSDFSVQKVSYNQWLK